jgi:RecA/RadA recombinase
MNRRDLFRSLPAAPLVARLQGVEQLLHQDPIRTGLAEFDELAGGLPTGSLSLVYGDREAGKTTLVNID